MPAPVHKRNEGIEIDEDFAFQLRIRRFQRTSQFFFLILLVCSVAGLLGGGPLSHRTAHDAAGKLSVRYERFARYDTLQLLAIEADAVRPDLSASFWIDTGFLRLVEIESMAPQPVSEASSAERALFSVGAPEGAERCLILVRYRPLAVGRVHGRVGSGGSSISFDQFVYP